MAKRTAKLEAMKEMHEFLLIESTAMFHLEVLKECLPRLSPFHQHLFIQHLLQPGPAFPACGTQDKFEEAGFREWCDGMVPNAEASLKSLHGVESKLDSEVLHLLAELAARIMKHRDKAGDQVVREVMNRVQALSDSLEQPEVAAASSAKA